MDDDFCSLEDHRGVQPDTVCTLLVCKNRTDHQLACPSSNDANIQDDVISHTTYISPSQLCNGVADCPSASDEEADICETRILGELVPDPLVRLECQALQNQFGRMLQMRPGLVIMAFEKTNTYLYETGPVLIWSRPDIMAGFWQYTRDPGTGIASDISSVVSQLILASETITLVLNMTSDKPMLPYTELNCRYDALFKIATSATEVPFSSTSMVASLTTAASPKEASPSSASEPQTAVAAGVGAAAAVFLSVLMIIRRRRRRHASALDELAPPVPQYIISQVISVIFVIFGPYSDKPFCSLCQYRPRPRCHWDVFHLHSPSSSL
jgi:hypothetical protein